MWDGGARGTAECLSSPGEHETGLPANMHTATFIPGELPVEAARLLAASLLSDRSRSTPRRLHSNAGSHLFENKSHR